MTTSVTIRRAASDDIDVLAKMLSGAFADEPFHRWLFPDADGRGQRARRLFRCELKNVLRDGLVLTDEQQRSAALWGVPDRPQGGWWSQAAIMVTLLGILGTRMRLVLRELEAVSALRPAAPHWYLSVIGTDPTARGQGLATAIMEHALALCDREGAGAWLETAASERHDFYERFGFTAQKSVQLASGPTIVGMWRAPAASPMSP